MKQGVDSFTKGKDKIRKIKKYESTPSRMNRKAHLRRQTIEVVVNNVVITSRTLNFD